MAVSEQERARRRRLVKVHVDAENAHDLNAIMATFAPHAVSQVNSVSSTTPEAIAQGHALYGMSAKPGVLSGLKVVHEREHFTDEEIIYEGRFRGKHTGTAPGFPAPTNVDVELPYVVVYRFDDRDKLVSERARIDFSPLLRGLFPIPGQAAGGTKP